MHSQFLLQVARKYHSLLESSIVLSFQTYMGGKIAEKLRKRSLQKSQGLFDEQIPMSQRFLSYFSLYSVMLFFGTAPLGVQRLVVHTIQPFAVAGIAQLFVIVIRNPWLSFIPLTLFLSVLLRSRCQAHKKSLHRQSKIFSLSRADIEDAQGSKIPDPPSDPYTACSDVEALYQTEVRPAASVCLEMTIPDSEVSMSGPQSLGTEMDEVLGVAKRKKILDPTSSNVSQRKSRPLYRGMFSLTDDDESEDEKLGKVRRRTKERRERAKRGSIDRAHSLSGGIQRTFSHLLRMVSFSEDIENKKQHERVEFDDPELSDSDFSSEGSRFDYSISGSDDSDEWIHSSAEEEEER